MNLFTPYKRLVYRSIFAVGMMLSAAPILAQTFPSKPVTLVVPYPPGGASDIMARAIATRMADDLKQPVIVENPGGASGAIAARRVLREKSDGYYLYVGSANELILAPLATSSPIFKSEDFRMVGKIGDLTLAIITRGGLPPNNTEELIAYAKKRSEQGNPLTYGSVGIGSLYHVLGKKMIQLTGAQMTHVPYKGGSPLTTDLIGGQIDVYLGAMGATSSAFLLKGSDKLKLISIISPKRLEQFRQVPSASATASLKHFTYSLWLGLFVKSDTPDTIVQSLHRAMDKALADPAVKTAAASAQFAMASPQSAAQADQEYTTSIAAYRDIAKSINFKHD